ncbi:molybdopterin-dependent oxidoreductase [Halobacillus sp. H74]|uniref:molybdopterin-dependent oxidoreductase n=1 Tax=Halobacillus sp. H74 TaxID=3457436 RepID=UPI003FCEA7A7
MRKKLVRLHHLHALMVIILLLSGAMLYVTPTRTWFNQISFPLVTFHIVIAIIYVVIVIFSLRPLLRYISKAPRLKKFNGRLMITAALLWSGSGVIMYFQASFPVNVRNQAVLIHDLSTLLMTPWIFTHTIGHFFHLRVGWPKWWRTKSPLPPVIQENVWTRRDFLKFSGIGLVFLAIGSSIKWMLPTFSIATEENKRRGYFRIYNVTNDYPRYEESPWNLRIEGLVDRSADLTMEDLRRLPATTFVDDFHCVTGWSVHGVEMKGVKVKDLLDDYEIKPGGEFVTAYSGDGEYYDSFRTSQLVDEGALLIYEFDGRPLKKAQGYPCRLYHPSMYGYKSVKWVNRLEFTKERELGYWQKSGGYDVDGYL